MALKNVMKMEVQVSNINNEIYHYYDTAVHWSNDNFGPLWVPQKGKSIPLTTDNYIRYERCIRTYEGNDLEIKNGKILLNGAAAKDTINKAFSNFSNCKLLGNLLLINYYQLKSDQYTLL